MHRLPRLPTGAQLTLCERSGKMHLILQNPSRYIFFWRSSTFLGIPRDLDLEFIGPSWAVGFPLGLPAVLHGILCYCFEGTSVCGSVCVWEAPSFGVSGTWCLAAFRLLCVWPLPWNLSLVQLRSSALPPLYIKKKTTYLCVFFFGRIRVSAQFVGTGTDLPLSLLRVS